MLYDTITILIAEDNVVDRTILTELVRGFGYNVITAHNGREAVDIYEKERPQIILLDVLMPVMDGFEAALKIKTLACNTLVPIIYITSLSDSESIVKGLEAGGDDFLSKPYNPTIIKAKIEAFNRVRLNHALLQVTLENLEASQQWTIEREKMASLGELVAGISHEINTPVGVAVTAISHLESTVKQLESQYANGTLGPNELDEFLAETKEGLGITRVNVERAAQLVKSFKQVAVDQSCESIRDIDIKQHLDDIIASLKPRFKNTGCRILVDCQEGNTCTCNPGALTHILTNLIVNSLVHGLANQDEGLISISASVKGNEVSMCYEDDGIGMPQAQLDKLFTPFFTTKRGQDGSGLGAHIIYNQVCQALHGNITATSEPGKGLHFDITFPKMAPTTLEML
ncbi:MAG: hypothetical protein COA42_06825 [Alteromonadaceae bacterium]|nr:MAG: hypothetical protein COA42_06825 [Alteromonadaceae bacterium]